MKPTRAPFRWSRIVIWLLAILAVGWLVWENRTRTSYGAVCARCLQRVHGLEVKCGGLTISNEQKLEKFRPDPEGGGGFILGTMPAVDPKIYTDITGHPCDHSFKRTGFCRYSGRGVGCGKSSEGTAFLLDQLVERLNHRDSDAGRKAVARLLEGPILGSSDTYPQDPWESSNAFVGSREQAVDRVRHGYSRSSDFGSLLGSMKALAVAHNRGHWQIAKRAYEMAVDGGISEFHCAIMAKSLMEIDPKRTVPFLMDELKKEDHRRLVTALAGMGLIASLVFTESIESFQKKPPEAAKENPYPPKYYFENGEPAKVLRYALHRCRRIQDWKLLRNETGKYFIKRI